MIVLIVSLLVIAIGVALFFILKKKKDEDKKKNKQANIKNKNPEPMNYIKPAEFNVGPIISSDPIYKSANLCNDKVLYPINGLDVNYGTKMGDNCPCTQFIQSP